MAERFGQRLARRLAGPRARPGPAPARGADSTNDSGSSSSRMTPKTSSVFCQPTLSISADRERREQELAERARRGAGAERDGAPARRQQLGEGADHERERAAGEAEADQHAGRQVELERRLRDTPSRRCRRRRAARRAMSTRGAPKRSASAPANGWPAPHSSISIASASAELVAAPAVGGVIGVRKKPKVERGPKLITPIRQPQTRMTSGVRQTDETVRHRARLCRAPRPAAPPASRRSAG